MTSVSPSQRPTESPCQRRTRSGRCARPSVGTTRCDIRSNSMHDVSVGLHDVVRLRHVHRSRHAGDKTVRRRIVVAALGTLAAFMLGFRPRLRRQLAIRRIDDDASAGRASGRCARAAPGPSWRRRHPKRRSPEIRLAVRPPANRPALLTAGFGRSACCGLNAVSEPAAIGDGGRPGLGIPRDRLARECAVGLLDFRLALILENPVHLLVPVKRHADLPRPA